MYYNLISRLIADHFAATNTASVLIVAALVVCAAVGYLLGSINSSLIISKKFFTDDIREHGSGNAGATNMLRTHGTGAAIATLVGDALKTALSVVCGGLLFGVTGAYIGGLFCIVGHIFPIWHGFRGGKGVVCVATMAAITSPFTFLTLLVIFLIIVIGTKYVSLGSVIAVMVYPLILFKIYSASGVVMGSFVGVLAAAVAAILIVWKHRENLKRINERTESKISFKKKKKGENGKAEKNDKSEKK